MIVCIFLVFFLFFPLLPFLFRSDHGVSSLLEGSDDSAGSFFVGTQSLDVFDEGIVACIYIGRRDNGEGTYEGKGVGGTIVSWHINTRSRVTTTHWRNRLGRIWLHLCYIVRIVRLSSIGMEPGVVK